MSEGKMHEEFEAWYRREVMRDAPEDVANQRFGKDRDGMYWDVWTRRSWQAWQASRAALVIELPPTVTADDVADALGMDDHDLSVSMAHMVNGAIVACGSSIKAAGVRVKT